MTADSGSEDSDDLSSKEFALIVRGHLNSYIKLADSKASILLSGLVAYLGLALGVIGANFNGSGLTFKISAVLTVFSGAIAAYYAASAVYPNTPETPQGLVLWESIVNNSIDEYRSKIKDKDSEELLDELIDENYKLAEVSDTKYDTVRKALWAVGATVLTGIATIVILVSPI